MPVSDLLPILAHGESYVQPVQKKLAGGPKPRPHEYEEARERLLADIGVISRQIQEEPDFYLEEKVVCVRMEPKFEAKSYAPSSMLTSSDELTVIGGRKYKTGNSQPAESKSESETIDRTEYAKLYFLRTTSQGIADFENALRAGANTSDAWRNEIMSIHSFDLLAPEEKVLGFSDEWTEGLICRTTCQEAKRSQPKVSRLGSGPFCLWPTVPGLGPQACLIRRTIASLISACWLTHSDAPAGEFRMSRSVRGQWLRCT